MTYQNSGSFSEFNPEEVIERIEVHLKRIEIIKEDAKKNWLQSKRVEGKRVGLPFFKKKIAWTEEELEHYWVTGPDDFYWHSPKYDLWDNWQHTINNFTKLRDFCQLAINAGNRTVSLSKEDALFAYNWS